MVWAKFKRDYDLWLWQPRQDPERYQAVARVEALGARLLGWITSHVGGRSMWGALNRLHQQLEQIKLSEHSFVDSHGHYLPEVGEMMNDGRSTLSMIPHTQTTLTTFHTQHATHTQTEIESASVAFKHD